MGSREDVLENPVDGDCRRNREGNPHREERHRPVHHRHRRLRLCRARRLIGELADDLCAEEREHKGQDRDQDIEIEGKRRLFGQIDAENAEVLLQIADFREDIRSACIGNAFCGKLGIDLRIDSRLDGTAHVDDGLDAIDIIVGAKTDDVGQDIDNILSETGNVA